MNTYGTIPRHLFSLGSDGVARVPVLRSKLKRQSPILARIASWKQPKWTPPNTWDAWPGLKPEWNTVRINKNAGRIYFEMNVPDGFTEL